MLRPRAGVVACLLSLRVAAHAMLYCVPSHPRSVVAGMRALVQGRRGQKDPRKFGCGRPGDHGSS